MGFVVDKRAVALLLVIILYASMKVSIAAVYKVGDSAGWTTIGNVDYKQWAATKTFQVNDVILFVYSPQFHNVLRVSHPHYRSCNASAPMSTHTTGNDSITITSHGHHYFFCGVPGHCQAGQKVDINVMRASSLPPTPSELPSVPAATVPSPPPSDAAPLCAFNRLLVKLGMIMAVFAVFNRGFA